MAKRDLIAHATHFSLVGLCAAYLWLYTETWDPDFAWQHFSMVPLLILTRNGAALLLDFVMVSKWSSKISDVKRQAIYELGFLLVVAFVSYDWLQHWTAEFPESSAMLDSNFRFFLAYAMCVSVAISALSLLLRRMTLLSRPQHQALG